MNTNDFINACRALCGRSYAEVDCIGVVRKALNIQCQGTNWLWRSTTNAAKYQYLTKKSNDINTLPIVQGGRLVFKVDWNAVPSGYTDRPDAHHVGVLTGLGTVIHSSPSTGVREEVFDFTEWDAWGEIGKFVEYAASSEVPAETATESTESNDLAQYSDRELLERIYRKVRD